MKRIIWLLPIILLTACQSSRLYRGEEVAHLVSRSDFTAAAAAAPEFTRAAIRVIGRLEYDYYQAKEQVRYCPKCREEIRQRLQRAIPAPSSSIEPPPVVPGSPPMPPLPTRP